METIAPGYTRPKVVGPVPPEAEKAIAASCPGAVVEAWADAPHRHPYWGPWRLAATGYATDPEVRFGGSSGGVITGLAIFALQAGLVDRVVHVAADPERATRNIMTVSTTPAEVLAGAGSRYASSSPLSDIDRILHDGGKLAFIGKPCDASAIRRLGRVDDRVARHVEFVLSFFCAGVPSHDGADRVIKAMGLDPSEVAAFRYRGNGWPGKARAVTRAGQIGEMTYADSWGGHLSREVQFRCKICPDGVGGVADVACADAWYGEDGYPRFEEQDGRSLIMARSEIGLQHLQSAIAAGAIEVEPLDVAAIDGMQPSQARRKRLVKARMAALTATLQPQPDVRGTLVGEAALHAKPAEAVKNFLGSTRRIVTGRR